MTKTEYYLRIARTVAEKSTCLKKQYGAIIINNDELVASGYNDTCRKEQHCVTCTKPSGNGDIEEYQKCPAVHAEMNSIISASRKEMIGADLYLAGREIVNDPDCAKREMKDPRPCEICLRLIKNAGINRVINRTGIIYERADNGIMYCLKEPYD
jgi:dCMP deaminase